jgi:hypothetical protein
MSIAQLPPYLQVEAYKYRIAKARRQRTGDYTTPDGIVRFVLDVLKVSEIAPYQEDILRALVTHKKVSVRSPHGAGKTVLAAWVILWGMCAFPSDVKIPTTASVWRQLTKFLWPEIHKWARRADWDKLGMTVRYGKELLEQSFKLPDGREAFALASNDPSAIEGAHAHTLLYVFDEAKAIPNGIWDAAEGAFSTATGDNGSAAFALAISTPSNPAGRFYDIHRRKPGYADWWTRHITLEEAIAAGRISREWADKRREQWGADSAVYQNRVEGNFSTESAETLIPLAWVEAANERWYALKGKATGKQSYGVDPARMGEDQTCIAHLIGSVIQPLIYASKQNTMATVDQVVEQLNYDTSIPIAVDVIGVGAGVHDRLNQLRYNSIAVNVASSTTLTDATEAQGFVNLRSALWWCYGRELLDPRNPNPIALPPDDLLTGDLTAPMYSRTSNGRIKVESKDDIKARIGRSTDSADAVLLALYAPYAELIKVDYGKSPLAGYRG